VLTNNKDSFKHEFAFYKENISSIVNTLPPGAEINLDDTTIYHRITNVVRLKPQETFIVFDQLKHITLTLKYTKKKKNVVATIVKKQTNKILKPDIEFVVPLLKKSNFESALYSLVELGTQTIQPIITKQSQQKWTGGQNASRYKKIIITAAEQSKHFSFSQLKNLVKLEEYLSGIKENSFAKIYFDPAGQPLLQTVTKIKSQKYEKIILMIGPEGDLIQKEKDMIKKEHFIFCKLTPTILRSFQAATVSTGAIRSLL